MGVRILGIVASVAVGFAPAVFLLGPVLFEHMPLSLISTPAQVASMVFAVFGAWLLLVSCVAPLEDLEKVLEPFQGSEAVFLFLPYMLFVGTRSIWRTLLRRARSGEP